MKPAITLAAAAVLAAAACGSRKPAVAPAPSPADSTRMEAVRGAGQTPPVYGLLGQREKLGLSSQQVVAIDSIGEDLRARNDSLLRGLRALRDSLGGDRMSGRDREQLYTRGQPLYSGVRDNNLRATRGIYDVLTPEQRVAACRTLRESAGGGMTGRPGASARGGAGGYGGGMGGYGRQDRDRRMPRDSMRIRPGRAVYWCPADTTKPVARP
jgi:hypothetical protein